MQRSVIALAAFLAVGGCDDASAPAKQDTPQQLIDAKYLDNKYDAQAIAACDGPVDDYLRSVAKYDFAWDDDTKGFMGQKFDRYSNAVPSPGILILVSDRAKLQNGFGAFKHITLYCRYNTQNNKVLSYLAASVQDDVSTPDNQ